MHRFFAGDHPLDLNSAVILDAAESRHLVHVVRMQRGNRVALFNNLGVECICEIVHADADAAGLVVRERLPAMREPAVAITLATPLLKATRFDLVLQKSVEIGAGCLIPFLSERSVVQWGTHQAGVHKLRRWDRIVLEATKQCGRAKHMRVEMPLSFDEALARAQEASCRFLLWEKTEQPLFSDLLRSLPAVAQSDTVFILTGPEGGFTDNEAGAAIHAGFRAASLGKRILRAETAAIVALALVAARWGEL